MPTMKEKPSLPEMNKIPILKHQQVFNANKAIPNAVKQDTPERNTLSNTTANTDHTNNIIFAEITDNPPSPQKLALIQDLLQITA